MKNEMTESHVIGIILILFVSNASATTIIVCPSGCTYSSIQTAIDAASSGDIIEVQSGTYYENVNATKTLTLIGNDTGTGKPLVNAAGIGSAITLSADGITLKGFNATRGGTEGIDAGIKVISHNNLIQDNIANNNGDNGIYLEWSNFNKLYNNIASNNKNRYGILLVYSSNNILYNNTINSNGYYGIQLAHSSSNNILIGNIARFNRDYGFVLAYSSTNNLLNGNYMTDNGWGIHFYLSNDNTLKNNIISDNGLGIWLVSSNNNRFYNNNMINNGASDAGTNQWDNGTIGNHWSAFDEPAEGCSDINNNGICDASYSISGSNRDNFPLLAWFVPPSPMHLSQTKTGILNITIVPPGNQADVGDIIDYIITATNDGELPLIGVSITDTLLGTLSCTPLQPAILEVGASMSCIGSYTFTQSDLNNGRVDNTAIVDSEQTELVNIQYSIQIPLPAPIASIISVIAIIVIIAAIYLKYK